MSTRGFITFVADGEAKTAYNHSDSYPDWLGVRVLKFVRDANHAALYRQIRALRVVSPDSKPTAEDIKRLSGFGWGRERHGGTADLREGQEWYDLLHETQGDPAAMFEAGVIEDASTFPADSLSAEWGYVIDLDGDGWLEVYRGFQHKPHTAGRFAGMEYEKAHCGGNQYYPVALAARWPLASLPSEDAFLAALAEDDGDA